MKLLRYFNHENIISILDIQKPRSYETFTEVYLIQACLSQFYSHSGQLLMCFKGVNGDGHAPGYSDTGSLRRPLPVLHISDFASLEGHALGKCAAP